jgi:hypothetical protein
MYKTTVTLTITSAKPFVKADKVEKAEAWIDAALTVGFKMLGTVSKFDVSDVVVDAEVSEKG